MSIKSTNSLDRHLGERMRMRRMLISMSQERLADALGLTFQQVQKYEKGTNRISASRLHQIADVLGVDIHFFFENSPADKTGRGKADSAELTTFLSTREGLELARAFMAIPNTAIRHAIINLARAAARREPEPVNGPGVARRAGRRSSAQASAHSP
jgi:transcriptional regulator with XRE-family HTH domain